MSTAIKKLIEIQNRAKLSERRVSEKYGHISTLDVIDAVSEIIDVASLTVKQGRGRGSFHTVTANLTPSLSTQALIGGNYCTPTIHVYNSYNGESPVRIMFGLYRLVCSNGLVIGQSVFKAEARHIKGPKLTSVLDGLRASVSGGVERLDDIMLAADRLDGVRCSRTDVERILDELQLSTTLYHKALRAYTRPVRQADVGDSGWLVYNRVQEVIAAQNTARSIELNQRLMQTFIDELKVDVKPKNQGLRLITG